MIKQRMKAYIEVINFHNTLITQLTRSAKWSNSKFESLHWSDQLSQFQFVYMITWLYKHVARLYAHSNDLTIQWKDIQQRLWLDYM